MTKTETVLLYQAIQQSNMSPTTKSFLGEVLKNSVYGKLPGIPNLTNRTKLNIDPNTTMSRMGIDPATGESFRDDLTLQNISTREPRNRGAYPNSDWATDSDDAEIMENAERFQRNLGGMAGNQNWDVDTDRRAELEYNN